jgi:hypothetical protein
MFVEIITADTIEIPEYIDLSTLYPENILMRKSIEWKSPGIFLIQQKGWYIISSDISLPILETEGITTREKVPKEITPYQAYEIALITLKSYEDKWNAFIMEEVSQLYLDEENDS